MIDLAQVLRDVPESGIVARQEQIEYIDIDLLGNDPNNFYELPGIEKLAENIELCGLMDPIRVRPDPENEARVIIVSGHRRRAAIQLLVDGGREDLRKVPCIREMADSDPRMQELRLIYANADTREMSNADKARQAERTEKLLYELKEAGREFPGRMRDHVAMICKMSKSKLSRLKVIREHLHELWVPSWEAGDLGESVAYALAQMTELHQRLLFQSREERNLPPKSLYEQTVKTCGERLAKIDKLGCDKAGGMCVNTSRMHQKALTAQTWEDVPCVKCCAECYNLGSCKNACPCLADEVKRLRDEKRDKAAKERAEKEERERPAVEQIQKLWCRFGEARIAANKDVEEVFGAIGRYYGSGMIQEAYQLEAGEGKVTASTYLPYGYTCSLDDIQKYVKAADCLGCSLDWLLCRTDDPNGMEPARDVKPIPSAGFWRTGKEKPNDGSRICVVDEDGFAEEARYDGGRLKGAVTDWEDVVYWTYMPEESWTKAQEEPVGQMALCGWMPGGTTPAEPCDVVAVFDVGGGKKNRMLARWTGEGFAFLNGAEIEMKPDKWMALPPEEDWHGKK